MGLRTQTLKGMHGGLNTVAQDLEGLEGPTQSPDLLNCFALPGTVYSRLGSAPWWDTGGTGPLYWFSFFKPLSVGGDDNVRPGTDLSDSETPVNESGATIDGGGWHWPTITRTPPRPRVTNTAFKILTPVNGTLNVDPAVALNIQWQQYRTGKLGYKIQIKDLDTGVEAYVKDRHPIEAMDLPANTLELSKEYVIKVWAITNRTRNGTPINWVRATNTPTFSTKLTVPTNLAPTGTINTLTPTFTCDAVVKAKRYKVKIYDEAGATLLHTSQPLLLPSYPIAAGVLSSGTNYKWTYTAYPDSVCTAEYGVESAQVALLPMAVPASHVYRVTFQPEPGTEDWLAWSGDYAAAVNGYRLSGPDRYYWTNDASSPRFFFTILDSTPTVITFGAQNVPGTDYTGSPDVASGIRHLTDGSTHWLEGSFTFRTWVPFTGFPLYKLEIISGT